MKRIFIFILISVFSVSACKQDKSHGVSDNAALIKSTRAPEEVLLAMRELGEDEEKKMSLIRDEMRANFSNDLEEKAVYIFRNILYNMDDENSIQKYVPIFLEEAVGRSGIQNFYDGLQAAYVTKYPQSAYSKTVDAVNTIATLLTKKADLINNPNFNRFSVPDAKDYIELSETFALVFPRDPAAGGQLIKGGNTAKSIPGYGAKAIAMYDWLLEKQPDHPKASQALFLKAFTYDNELKKPSTAGKYYREFISKYPNDDFADDAQLLLENLGKTDQEFYETIVKKKGEQES